MSFSFRNISNYGGLCGRRRPGAACVHSHCWLWKHYSMGLGPCSTYWLLVLSVIPAAVIVIQLSNSIQWNSQICSSIEFPNDWTCTGWVSIKSDGSYIWNICLANLIPDLTTAPAAENARCGGGAGGGARGEAPISWNQTQIIYLFKQIHHDTMLNCIINWKLIYSDWLFY